MIYVYSNVVFTLRIVYRKPQPVNIAVSNPIIELNPIKLIISHRLLLHLVYYKKTFFSRF